MKKQTRRKFTPEFKAKVALEAVKNQQTLAELGLKFELSPVIISKWKGEFLENMSSVFEKGMKNEEEQGPDVDELYAQIGKLKSRERVFKKKLQETGDMKGRINLIEPHSGTLSIRAQCSVLGVSRSNLYYKPKEEKAENLEMMLLMDKHLINHPTEGVNSMVYWLTALGFVVGHKRIRRLFKVMGRQTLYRRKNLTKAGLREYIRPYLLRNLKIDRANQVWVTDITYVPMAKGFMYLTAVMDVYSRKILAWGLSNSQDAAWCLQVVQEAILRYGKPEIINSDQGSQYTSARWIDYLQSQEIEISMDGKGRALDNVWIERFWKSIKYDYIYLNPCKDGFELADGIKAHMDYYNQKTHHTTEQKPNDRYEKKPVKQAA